MPRKNEKAAASVIILDAPNMTPSGKRAIARWLQAVAENLIKDGKFYDKRFKATYWYENK